MNPSNDENALAAALGSVLVFCIIAGLLATAMIGPEKTWVLVTSSGAAWIQAIGSVAAIFVAIDVSRRQRDADRALEQDRNSEAKFAKIRVIDSLLEVMEKAAKLCRDHHQSWPQIPVPDLYIEKIDVASNALAKLDPYTCPPELVEPLLLHLFPRPCDTLIRSLQEFNKSFDELKRDDNLQLSRVFNSFNVNLAFISNARNACRKTIEIENSRI